MNKNLLIIGAGQYGMVAKEVALVMQCFEKIDFIDDNNPIAIGEIEEIKSFANQYTYAFCAIGNADVREEIVNKLKRYGFVLPTLIHPQAYVSPSAKIECACIVEPMAVVNSEAVVQEGSFICAGAIANHNSIIGKYCHIDVGAIIEARSVIDNGIKIK